MPEIRRSREDIEVSRHYNQCETGLYQREMWLVQNEIRAVPGIVTIIGEFQKRNYYSVPPRLFWSQGVREQLSPARRLAPALRLAQIAGHNAAE